MKPLTLILSKVPKWAWVVLIIILLALILRGPIKRGWAGITNVVRRDAGDYSDRFTDGQGQPVTGELAQQRLKELKDMAAEAYAQLNAAIINPAEREKAISDIADTTNDFELRQVAKEYKVLDRNKSLYQAVDDAWMPFTSVDERLLGRLSKINMR